VDDEPHNAPRARAKPRGTGKHFGEGATRVDTFIDIQKTIQTGETIELVGLSGNGKSVPLNVIG
jgi:predicted ABC-type transport system involved in lysophospholipase L1 biosynthesis ATPase subunit